MSIPISSSVLLNLAAPIMGKVIREIANSTVTEENLIKAKETIINTVFTMTGKTPFTWDDEFAELLIKDLCQTDVYQKYGDKLLDAVELVVAHTDTVWDDRVILPAVEVLRSVANLPDGED